MAKVGAQRAAELTGKSKSTIQRAMKSGKISYEIDHNSRRVIDVAELERAFGLAPQDTGASQDNVEAELKKAADMLETERLKMRIKMLEEQLGTAQEQLEDMKAQRDQWQKQAQQILITSQYSQKQAEEMKAEMKERERRARERHQKSMEQRMKQVQNENRQKAFSSANSNATEDEKSAFDIQGLWHKIRGNGEKEKASA